MNTYIQAQCSFDPANTALKGTFIRDKNTGEILSPVFDSLAGLFPWMRYNGWKLDEYNNSDSLEGYHPWRVTKTARYNAQYTVQI